MQKSPSAHHRTICPAVSSQLRHVSTIGKTLNSNISSTRRHNMVRVGPLTAEIGWWVWGTQQISTGFASWLRYCTNVAQRRSTTLCTMFGRLLGCYTMYRFFGGSCPLTEFCQVQNSLCVQVLRSPILAALLHGTPAVGVSQTLQRGIFTRQGGHPVRHRAVELCRYNCVLPYLSTLENAIVFKGAVRISRFTLL